MSEISRIIVLGSTSYGPNHFGIVGVSKNKIYDIPVTGVDKSRRHRCGAPPKACFPSQFFTYQNDHDRSYPTDMLAKLMRWIPSHVVRIDASTNYPVMINRSLPMKLIKPWRASNSRNPEAFAEWSKRWKEMSNLEKYRDTWPDGIVKLDPRSVNSPIKLMVDALPPSWEGLALLEERGAIHGPGSQEYRRLYRSWNEKVNIALRSPLDPTFDASLKVDFVITSKIRIPRELQAFHPNREVSFLVSEGTPTPIVGKRQGHTCLYFADERTSRHECKNSRISRALKKLKKLQKRWKNDSVLHEVNLKKCRLTVIPDKTEVVAIATYSGIDEQDTTRLGAMGCLKKKSNKKSMTDSEIQNKIRCPEGRVTVKIEKPGRSFLVLWSQRPVKWYLKPSEESEIVGALIVSDFKHEIIGLPETATFEQIESDEQKGSLCRGLRPARNTHAGGPAATLLDEVIYSLTGRRLDRFLRKPYVDWNTKSAVNETLIDYSTFVID